jgi:hypothetical protein
VDSEVPELNDAVASTGGGQSVGGLREVNEAGWGPGCRSSLRMRLLASLFAVGVLDDVDGFFVTPAGS